MTDNILREQEAKQLDAEAFNVLAAISVVKRLAQNLSAAERERGGDPDERSDSI